MPTNYKKRFVELTEQELLDMTEEEACEQLTEKQKKFCEYYIKNHNAILSAKKAGYSPDFANCVSWKIKDNFKVNRYLAWLKLRIGQEYHIHPVDIIGHYAKIAFSDISDFITVKHGKVFLTDTENIDGQLVKIVKFGKYGTTVELHDKLLALQKLERYFDVMPKDWREKIEERKVAILEQQLELNKIKAGQVLDSDYDDGFMEALKETSASVWETEGESE